MGPMPPSTIEDKDFTSTDVSPESQVLITQLVSIRKEDHFNQSYGLPAKFSESHVIRLAIN